jgi:hypothetical protein
MVVARQEEEDRRTREESVTVVSIVEKDPGEEYDELECVRQGEEKEALRHKGTCS